jgi:hypothetical protein
MNYLPYRQVIDTERVCPIDSTSVQALGRGLEGEVYRLLALLLLTVSLSACAAEKAEQTTQSVVPISPINDSGLTLQPGGVVKVHLSQAVLQRLLERGTEDVLIECGTDGTVIWCLNENGVPKVVMP